MWPGVASRANANAACSSDGQDWCLWRSLMLHRLASLLGKLEAHRTIFGVHVRFRGSFEARWKLAAKLLNDNVKDSDRNDIIEAICKSDVTVECYRHPPRARVRGKPGEIRNPNC